MKMEFNGNGFSAEMKPKKSQTTLVPEGFSPSKYLGFILGCLSLLTALLWSGLGLVFDSITDLFILVFGFTTVNYIAFMLVTYLVTTVISVTCGISSIVTYKKQEPKHPLSTIGLIFSITSFVVCGILLVLNIFLFTYL